MLLQLLDFIKREQVVSLKVLSREFCIDEEALQPMLSIWIKRGVIELCDEKMECNTKCFGCNSSSLVFYQFIVR